MTKKGPSESPEIPDYTTGFVGRITREMNNKGRLPLNNTHEIQWNGGEITDRIVLTPFSRASGAGRILYLFPAGVLKKKFVSCPPSLIRLPDMTPDNQRRFCFGKNLRKIIGKAGKKTLIGKGPYLMMGGPKLEKTDEEALALTTEELRTLLHPGLSEQFFPESISVLQGSLGQLIKEVRDHLGRPGKPKTVRVDVAIGDIRFRGRLTLSLG